MNRNTSPPRRLSESFRWSRGSMGIAYGAAGDASASHPARISDLTTRRGRSRRSTARSSRTITPTRRCETSADVFDRRIPSRPMDPAARDGHRGIRRIDSPKARRRVHGVVFETLAQLPHAPIRTSLLVRRYHHRFRSVGAPLIKACSVHLSRSSSIDRCMTRGAGAVSTSLESGLWMTKDPLAMDLLVKIPLGRDAGVQNGRSPLAVVRWSLRWTVSS